MTSALRDFLEIPYDELEALNLAAKEQHQNRVSLDTLREERMKYLADEKRIKAVTVCFTDLEGRLHMLDYDKKFLLKSVDNLTFDGSSIRGFSQQFESDLRLAIDWSAFYWLPSDVFGPGKVLVFGAVLNRDGSAYPADMRLRLQQYTQELFSSKGYTCNVANEIEGCVRQINVDGFWIHFDTDVINDELNPAVDYRLPGGLSFEQCQTILTGLIQKYPTVGMSVTIFNPNLDTGDAVARKIVTLISNILG